MGTPIELWVGEQLAVAFSFKNELARFPGSSIATPVWTSQDTAVATFNAATGAIVTTNIGQDAGLTNDGAQGTFTGVAAGTAYVKVSVTASNPANVWVGVIQLTVKAIPS